MESMRQVPEGEASEKNTSLALKTCQQAEEQIPQEELENEVGRLQSALSSTLKQLQKLQQERDTLEKQLAQERRLNETTQAEKEKNRALKQQKDAAEQRCRQLQYRLDYMGKKYHDLANSKLGRLTLNYWAWQGQKGTSGKGAGNWFFVRWLFDRLPHIEGEVLTFPSAEPEMKQIQVLGSGKEESAVAHETVNETVLVDKMTEEQERWAQPYLERIKEIAESNGCRYYKKISLRIGIVCDEFFYDSIKAAAHFVYLTPENWKNELEQGLDVLLFVSAWRGLNMEWKNLASLNAQLTGEPTPTRLEALAMLRACRERKVPTVFYSKEDPPNYELFLDLAKECDYVFTSAKECIPYYNADCGRDDVQAVCFGINPLEHNPIGCRQEAKEDTVLFSGSWMVKYPHRCQELATIFDGVLAAGHGLHIIDRNYPGNPRYRFPEPYSAHTSPALPHSQLQKVHKLFDWAININSVKGSETMFANRAFELQANGILLLSNFSVGVNNLLPTVQMVQDSSEVASILDAMTPEERYERQMAGVRSVMTDHTCFDRLAQLLAPTGLPVEQPARRVLVLADAVTDRVRRCFDLQSYPEKALLAASEATPALLEEYDMVAWFAPEAHYGVFYLEDMVNGFKYTACDYITKDAWREGGALHAGTEHSYVSRMGSKYRTLFWRSAYDAAFPLSPTDGAELPNGYSIDHFQYDARPVEQDRSRTDWRLSVVVPVYNNGRHLYGKCFASLRRSSIFSDMEIILVDDGSTDSFTLLVEEDLKEHYPNVRLYRFEDGGSGSASRPRNKGVELATAPYLTFLDPDNEAVFDGYARLLELAEGEDRDLAVGSMYKITSKTTLADYYSMIVDAAGKDSFEDGFGATLPEAKFFSASIQAMVIRTKLIRDNHLEQVPGAAGQDTLFSWQLFQAARKIQILNLPIHIYYAETAGSVTNTVSTKFFRKLLLLQQPKADWLLASGLMEDFMARRYNYYTTHWIFFKLARAQDAPACAALVEQMLDIFAPYYRGGDQMIDDFTALCKKGDYAGAAELVQKAFPLRSVRPMPTLEELAKDGMAAKLQTTYRQEGTTFRLTNRSGVVGDTYAWVILAASGKYEKLYGTKYTSDPQFCYDYSVLQPGTYKVRAFLRHDGEKISDDVAVFRVYEDKTVQLLPMASKTKREEGDLS